jgi:hypothetical protein
MYCIIVEFITYHTMIIAQANRIGLFLEVLLYYMINIRGIGRGGG